MTAPTSDLDWEPILFAALEGQGVHVVFQPVIDLQRLSVAGYEALARFEGAPGRGPDEWFAVARRLGVADRLDAAVLRCALARRRDLPPNQFLNLNVEPPSLGSAAVEAVLGASSLDGVVLELTEHEPIESYDQMRPLLDRYRAAGALFAVDDAGSGYAGLQHILTIRPSFLKLDRSLVTDVHLDGAKAALIEMLGTFANRIDAWVIAEGVEVEAEAVELAQLSVPLVQGYLFARPGPPWGDIEPAARAALQRHRQQQPDSSLREVLHVAPWVGRDGVAAGRAALARGEGTVVVVVDAEGRPVGTLDLDGALVERVDPPFKVSLSTSPQELARRLLTRPTGEQLVPAVCCDSAGRYVGVVTAARLLRRLADLVDEADLA